MRAPPRGRADSWRWRNGRWRAITVGVASIDENRRTSFDAKASQYDRMRPSYPDALVDDVLARTGARRIVEVGAGTGQATKVFARRPCTILALEPGPNLASLLRRNVAGHRNVVVEGTTFEEWRAEDRAFDLVLSAQAFHWVDPAVRYAKAARVARHLAILTNEKDRLDPALRADFDAAYARWTGGDGNDTARDRIGAAPGSWTEGIEGSGLYGPVHVGLFPWQASYTAREYVALIDTYSDHATLEEGRRLGLYEAIAASIDRHGGRIVVPYVAMAFVATPRASQ